MSDATTYALYERIYRVIAQIPYGQAATYGDIAVIVGGGCDGRVVGYALRELPPERVAAMPWQRVINRDGGISTRGLLQRQLLEAEGAPFDAHGRVILARCRWAGPSQEWAATNGFNMLPPREEAEQLGFF